MDMAGDVRPDSGVGVLLSTEKRREMLIRIGGGEAVLPKRSSGNAGGGEFRCLRQGRRVPSLGSIGRN